MNRGPDVSGVLPHLARSKGYSQARLEEATGIGHSTMSRYWSGRGGLGEKNGRRIAEVLDVSLEELGLGAATAGDDLGNLRLAHAALEEALRLLTARVEALERTRATPQRSSAARRQRAG
jgi:transcriptional regulator with XRE-family HTH domain